MSSDGGDGWRKPSSSAFSRLVNPELHMKPNLPVGIIGTSIFFLVIGGLLWQKRTHERQQTALNKPPKSVEELLIDDQ
ncbi:hypothetical protein KP509_13G008500 [Ceratopteris richardii]|uniref:Uncharacterized protein n=1 Tax=Ceratopteris richardii TaxID=49495 RepID=A0A8T2TDD3_CERRI|nr:hypothetical protein KP509_13G008500 [Ceratopteris richardii]